MAFKSTVHGRLEIVKGDKTLGAFSLRRNGYDYYVLAEFQVNKWVPFWSAKTESIEDDYLTIVRSMTDNMYNFFANIPATENVNDEAVEFARQF